ncbi:hypothetical protein CHS0354_015936 [Potamilus streckersoni]|uniref:Uncharacterized protein n=1 Tax=Potamilus streckersoni TaxID=2493646 RepID=A0AAE0RQN6_9BIVA|nr:hypothetical protein CHS0354_015936 [Potamilus streckersoni]
MFPGQEKGKCSENEDATFPNQNLSDLKERKTSASLQIISTDETRQLMQNYYVKIAVLIDSGVWE